VLGKNDEKVDLRKNIVENGRHMDIKQERKGKE